MKFKKLYLILFSLLAAFSLLASSCSRRSQETMASESAPSPSSSEETYQESSSPSSEVTSQKLTSSSQDTSQSTSYTASQELASSLDPSQESPPSSGAVENTPPKETESSSQPPLTFKVTIPEGYTLARIGMLLEEKGVCTVSAFLEAAQTGDFSEFPLVAAQPPNSNRCFKLEGYLFPDTYEFYTGADPDSILRVILTNTEKKITQEMRQLIAANHFTVDEIIALASIVEKEAFGSEAMPKISSVLHNRLKEKMRLECDVTITYVEGAIKPFITGDINRYNSFYNTYKCAALPAGAICNPGLEAIWAAIAPEKTEFLFFVTDKQKNYYYNTTLEEHEEQILKIKAADSSAVS